MNRIDHINELLEKIKNEEPNRALAISALERAKLYIFELENTLTYDRDWETWVWW